MTNSVSEFVMKSRRDKTRIIHLLILCQVSTIIVSATETEAAWSYNHGKWGPQEESDEEQINSANVESAQDDDDNASATLSAAAGLVVKSNTTETDIDAKMSDLESKLKKENKLELQSSSRYFA